MDAFRDGGKFDLQWDEYLCVFGGAKTAHRQYRDALERVLRRLAVVVRVVDRLRANRRKHIRQECAFRVRHGEQTSFVVVEGDNEENTTCAREQWRASLLGGGVTGGNGVMPARVTGVLVVFRLPTRDYHRELWR